MSNINRKLRNLYIAKWAQTNFADYQVSETINFLPEAQKFSFKNLTEEKPSSLEVCNNRNEEGKKISIKLYERTDVVRFRLVKVRFSHSYGFTCTNYCFPWVFILFINGLHSEHVKTINKFMFTFIGVFKK